MSKDELATSVPSAVIEAIKKVWPDQADDIFESLHEDRICGCYYFTRWGMYVGVEYDGYIHT